MHSTSQERPDRCLTILITSELLCRSYSLYPGNLLGKALISDSIHLRFRCERGIPLRDIRCHSTLDCMDYGCYLPLYFRMHSDPQGLGSAGTGALHRLNRTQSCNWVYEYRYRCHGAIVARAISMAAPASDAFEVCGDRCLFHRRIASAPFANQSSYYTGRRR